MYTTRITATLLALSLGLAACGKPATENSKTDNDSASSAAPTAAEPAALARTPSPEGARVFFITPADGATVTNPIAVEFGIEGMNVARAGDDQPNSGHHHLLIDTDLPDPGLPIPATPNHVHFGDGSTSTEISLDPGTHSLQMLLGDHRHIPHDPLVVSEPITITVE